MSFCTARNAASINGARVSQVTYAEDKGPELAHCDGLPIYRHAGEACLSETERDEKGREGVWVRFPLQAEAYARHIRESVGVRGDGALGHGGPSSERHDRHPVVPLGFGFR